jgi:hypothetical protein
MKLLTLPMFIVLIALLSAPCNIASAQTTSQNPPAKSDQWQSHQMNQPPPGSADRYSISKDRLDEIRKLYLQAKQELEKKVDEKPTDKK